MPSRFIRSEQPEALRRGLSWLYAFVRPQRGAILRLLALSLLASALVLLQPWLTKLLIDDGLLARETWSNPHTGAFAFDGLDERQQFIALAEDGSGVYAPVAADRRVPGGPA